MGDEWEAVTEFESLASFDSPPEALIVPETPPEVIARWEIERAADCYNRSGGRRRFGGGDGSEVVEDTEIPPPAQICDGSETQPPFQLYADSETPAPSEGFYGFAHSPQVHPYEDSETQPPSEGFHGSHLRGLFQPHGRSESHEQARTLDASEPQPHPSTKVEYSENEKAMLLILLPSMKDLL